MTEVVAALIWDKFNKKFMICQRPANKSRGLLWEFAGGKVEPNESKEAALARELKEELNINAKAESIFTEVTHIYPDIKIHLTLFNTKIISGTPEKIEHNDIRWITADEISNYEFCPADTEILKLIQEKSNG